MKFPRLVWLFVVVTLVFSPVVVWTFSVPPPLPVTTRTTTTTTSWVWPTRRRILPVRSFWLGTRSNSSCSSRSRRRWSLLSSSTTNQHHQPEHADTTFEEEEDRRRSRTQQQQQQQVIVDELNALLEDESSATGLSSLSFIKTCKVKIGPSTRHGWGLLATQDLKAGESALKIALLNNDRGGGGGGEKNNDGTAWEISKATAQNVFRDYLPNNYDSWTGEVGLMALQLLNERARMSGTAGPAGIPRSSFLSSQRSTSSSSSRKDKLLDLWLSLLPSYDDSQRPLLWNEDDQEVLQSSTTNKIYRRLDDLEEDFNWLTVNVFAKDRTTFPETVLVVNRGGGDNVELPCFSLYGFKWAMSIVQSRSFFVDGALRLIPIIDFCNHDEDNGLELTTTSANTGIFGGGGGNNNQAASVSIRRAVPKGDEVTLSYGPRSAAEYLLDHGFVPSKCWSDPIVQVTVEIDPTDRFYDDKLDILEFETYEAAPMDPVQKFDLQVNDKKGPIPDPALVQFLRLRALGQYDAFLLESVFRKEAWGFMALPVSETNELAIVEYLLETCQAALDEFAACPTTTTATTPTAAMELCRQLRVAETSVLERLVTILEQEKQGLHLKEYYQERRLKDLGLDSVWTPEDDTNLDETDATLSYGQTRAPGGADYDW